MNFDLFWIFSCTQFSFRISSRFLLISNKNNSFQKTKDRVAVYRKLIIRPFNLRIKAKFVKNMWVFFAKGRCAIAYGRASAAFVPYSLTIFSVRENYCRARTAGTFVALGKRRKSCAEFNAILSLFMRRKSKSMHISVRKTREQGLTPTGTSCDGTPAWMFSVLRVGR